LIIELRNRLDYYEDGIKKQINALEFIINENRAKARTEQDEINVAEAMIAYKETN